MSSPETTTTAPSFGEVEILDASYIPECANVMAEAFADSPAYSYIFQKTRKDRVAALEWLFIRNLNLTVVTKQCPSALRGIRNLETGKVACCFLWCPTEYSNLTMWEMVCAGMWLVPFKFGYATLSRLLDVMEKMEYATGKVKEEEKVQEEGNSSNDNKENVSKPPIRIILNRMVVHPTWQGQGLGSKALKAVLDEEMNKGGLVKIYLDTQEERNVTFYKRLGWEVVNSQTCYEDNPTYKFHSWNMVRSFGGKE